MVQEIKKNNKVFYRCEDCDLYFKEKDLAQRCEDWSKKTKSCNLEIIKFALKKNFKSKK